VNAGAVVLTKFKVRRYNQRSDQRLRVRRHPPIESGRTMRFLLCVIGMVMIFEGLPYFAFPQKMKHWMLQIMAMPEDILRRFGLVLMISGLALVYLGRHGIS
jgi:uncharacterized protein YjeT (DUF2065 family)